MTRRSDKDAAVLPAEANLAANSAATGFESKATIDGRGAELGARVIGDRRWLHPRASQSAVPDRQIQRRFALSCRQPQQEGVVALPRKSRWCGMCATGGRR